LQWGSKKKRTGQRGSTKRKKIKTLGETEKKRNWGKWRPLAKTFGNAHALCVKVGREEQAKKKNANQKDKNSRREKTMVEKRGGKLMQTLKRKCNLPCGKRKKWSVWKVSVRKEGKRKKMLKVKEKDQ